MANRNRQLPEATTFKPISVDIHAGLKEPDFHRRMIARSGKQQRGVLPRKHIKDMPIIALHSAKLSLTCRIERVEGGTKVVLRSGRGDDLQQLGSYIGKARSM